MSKYNQANERIKHKYRLFLKEAKQHSEASLDAANKAIARFEDYNKNKDFKRFHVQQAVGFKKHLFKQKSELTEKPLSKATLNSSLRHLKAFFEWLSREPGYKSSINYSDAEYFHLSEKDTRIATAKRLKPVPTMEQIKHVIAQMPIRTDIEKRDRALIAFAIATGARDKAITTIKLKHLDLANNCLHQDAREVATKFSKTFDTFFFPVGDEIIEMIADWVEYLLTEKHWGDDDPLFPSTETGLGESRRLEVIGMKREHWRNAGPIRRIFRVAFSNAGLAYYNPHSFRNTLAGLGEKLCRSPEEFKAWSQNLGHEQVMTTFSSYGEVPVVRQAELIRRTKVNCVATDTGELLSEIRRLINSR
ncbi:MAG: site-specific integrase [Proteobacteria bacterium]|nr:site-specific integrase [Pseudomonadota bacterium]